MERVVVAVDLGTGGPKVGFVSLADGTAVWSTLVPVETRWLEGGGAVQDAGEWWDCVCRSVRTGIDTAGVEAAQVVGVALTGQWASTVAVDVFGLPVAECVMWMDRRGSPHARKVIGGPVAGLNPVAAAVWIRRSGVPPSPEGDDTLGHMLHIQYDQPETAARASWYLEPVDYLAMRFTGVAAASPASMIGAWLTDNRPGALCAYDPVLVRRSGVDPAKLPPLVPTGSTVGTVTRESSAVTGIPAGVPVVTGIPDLHSAAVGSGAIDYHRGHMAISTTSWISCPVMAKKTDVINQMATVPGLGPGQHLVVNNQDSAGRCLEWARDVLAPGSSYEELLALAGPVPAGAGNVLFTPWLKGERSPIADRFARGGFHNLSLATGRGELVRAVLEGVAYNSRWLLEATEKFAGHRLDPLRLIGGGARSDLWCQIIADVTGHRIERVADPQQANLRGAGLYAGVALGILHRDQVPALARVDRGFVPDPGTRSVYDRLFAEYKKLHGSQKKMFRRMNGIDTVSR